MSIAVPVCVMCMCLCWAEWPKFWWVLYAPSRYISFLLWLARMNYENSMLHTHTHTHTHDCLTNIYWYIDDNTIAYIGTPHSTIFVSVDSSNLLGCMLLCHRFFFWSEISYFPMQKYVLPGRLLLLLSTSLHISSIVVGAFFCCWLVKLHSHIELFTINIHLLFRWGTHFSTQNHNCMIKLLMVVHEMAIYSRWSKEKKGWRRLTPSEHRHPIGWDTYRFKLIFGLCVSYFRNARLHTKR